MGIIRGLALCLAALLSNTFAQDVETAVGETVTESQNEPILFRIGSGYNNGIYFMLATVLGGIISHPEGDLPCEHGGNCGVDDLILVNVSTPGSAANITKLEHNQIDSAFVQSNIAYWRYTASGLYVQDKPFDELRALASLYPEMLHLVVHADSDIESIEDLAGKRVAVGAQNSGTFINVGELLNAYSMNVSQFEAIYDDAPQAVAKFLDDKLDAVFFVAGVPTPQVQYLSTQTDIRLIPISSVQRDALLSHNHYYTSSVIPKGIYKGVDENVPTVAVQALWVVREELDPELAYQLTKALWRDDHAYWLHHVLPDSALNIAHSLDGIGIPLHPGAKRYYNEIGKRF